MDTFPELFIRLIPIPQFIELLMYIVIEMFIYIITDMVIYRAPKTLML